MYLVVAVIPVAVLLVNELFENVKLVLTPLNIIAPPLFPIIVVL